MSSKCETSIHKSASYVSLKDRPGQRRKCHMGMHISLVSRTQSLCYSKKNNKRASQELQVISISAGQVPEG